MKTKFIPAYLLVFVNVLGFSILLPVLPFVVEDYGGSKVVYGAILSSYSIFQAIGAPYLGRLSDTAGRKKVLMISQAGTLAAWIIFGLAYFLPAIPIWGISLPLIVIAIARVLDGITGGNNAVANAYVTDITTQKEKSYIFGTLGGIAGIGMIIGPGVGGFLSSGSIGYLGMVIGAAILSFVTLASIALWLKESLPEEKRKQPSTDSSWQAFRLIRRIRHLNPPSIILNIYYIRFLFSIMMAAYISTIALFMIDLFQFNEKELGLFMLVVGLFISFNQAFVAKRFIIVFGEYRPMQIGLALSMLGLISITLTAELWLYILLYYILNLGISLCIPCFNALLAKHADPNDAGEIMGISISILSYCNAFVPIIATGLYSMYGSTLYLGLVCLPLLGLLVSKPKYATYERPG